jgi:hypothetical protein
MGRERVDKKQHTHQKAELFHTFRVFFAFAPLRLLQNAKTLLPWHACLGPRADPPVMLPSCRAAQRSAMHTRAHEEAARQGPKAHHHPSIPSTCKEQDMLNSNTSEINPETAGLYSSTADIIGNRQSAIGNRQSAIGNRQSAIGNRQSAIGNRQSAI